MPSLFCTALCTSKNGEKKIPFAHPIRYVDDREENCGNNCEEIDAHQRMYPRPPGRRFNLIFLDPPDRGRCTLSIASLPTIKIEKSFFSAFS